MPTSEPFGLERFTAAQEPVYPAVLEELRAGRKTSHWMWFVFPQAAGLGFSAMSRRYAIGSGAEAAAYLAHPVLGARLRECTGLVLALPAGRSAFSVFGDPDTMKFRSSMELFAGVAGAGSPFGAALGRFFA